MPDRGHESGQVRTREKIRSWKDWQELLKGWFVSVGQLEKLGAWWIGSGQIEALEILIKWKNEDKMTKGWDQSFGIGDSEGTVWPWPLQVMFKSGVVTAVDMGNRYGRKIKILEHKWLQRISRRSRMVRIEVEKNPGSDPNIFGQHVQAFQVNVCVCS